MNDKKNREPMVIALATGKGGSMKTTSAVFLACALVDQSRGEQHVLVADADVQGDARDWWYRAAELDDPLPFDVMSAAPADIAHLHGINDRLDDPVDWVLIDSAPYGRALDESVNNADLVVIPSSPSRIDLDQAVGVKDLCDRRGVPAAILLCRTEANWTGNGVLDRFLEDESLFGEFLRTPVSEGGVESLVVEPPHIVVEVGA